MIIPTKSYGSKKDTQKKVKIATQDKSKKCYHSKCPFPAAEPVNIGHQIAYLCKKHYTEYKAYTIADNHAIFYKASNLL